MSEVLTYTEHARQIIEQRQIDEQWIRRVVEFPALELPHRSDPELLHRFGRIAEREGRVLHVVLNRNESRVVTAYFDRMMRGKL